MPKHENTGAGIASSGGTGGRTQGRSSRGWTFAAFRDETHRLPHCGSRGVVRLFACRDGERHLRLLRCRRCRRCLQFFSLHQCRTWPQMPQAHGLGVGEVHVLRWERLRLRLQLFAPPQARARLRRKQMPFLRFHVDWSLQRVSRRAARAVRPNRAGGHRPPGRKHLFAVECRRVPAAAKKKTGGKSLGKEEK